MPHGLSEHAKRIAGVVSGRGGAIFARTSMTESESARLASGATPTQVIKQLFDGCAVSEGG